MQDLTQKANLSYRISLVLYVCLLASQIAKMLWLHPPENSVWMIASLHHHPFAGTSVWIDQAPAKSISLVVLYSLLLLHQRRSGCMVYHRFHSWLADYSIQQSTVRICDDVYSLAGTIK